MNMNKRKRDITKILKSLGLRGAEIYQSAGHLKINHPMLTQKITCSCTPSCKHSLEKIEKDVKRAMK